MRITDADIDRYLAEQQGAVNDPAAQEVNLAHLLIAVPEKASADEVAGCSWRKPGCRGARAGTIFGACAGLGGDRSNGGPDGFCAAESLSSSLFVQANMALTWVRCPTWCDPARAFTG